MTLQVITETIILPKNEDILNGDTVKYVNYQDIESYFDYDFKEEKEFDYSKLNNDELIKHIAKFTSSILASTSFLEKATQEQQQYLLKSILTIWDLMLIMICLKSIAYILEML